MYLKYFLVVSYFIFIFIPETHSQVNVFGNSCESYSPYIFDFMPASYETHCFELPEEQSSNVSQYTFSSEREIKAASHIEFADSMELTPETGGSLYAYIKPLSFEVLAYVQDLNSIPKLSKFELGIKPPENILSSIQNFLNETGSQELNPYMSDEIHVEAIFKHVTTDTVTYYDPPNHPEEVIYTDSIIKKRDGFFTKEVERDISGFDDLYNHSLANNDTVVSNAEYPNLGGGWTVSDSDYPFRIRFAPPKVGEWTCQIKISILEGQQVYVSPTFKFNVVDSNKKDYLKVDGNNRFLKRDGETYRPIGANYSWPSGNGYPLRGLDNGNKLVNEPQYHGVLPPIATYEQYLRYMDTLAMNGVNYFRLIMSPFSLDIEYEKLGDYSDRMHIAKEMDLILERAEQNDMLIHWNLMLHFQFQENPFYIKAWDWPGENGGNVYCYKDELNLNSPLEFLTNDTARKYYKERLRYIVARWGYSPDIAMFEHFSEINQIGTVHGANGEAVSGTNQYAGNEAVFSDWHGEMSWYLKEVLEIPQLLTLSYTTKHNEELDHSFWHGNIDVINHNNYNYGTGDSIITFENNNTLIFYEEKNFNWYYDGHTLNDFRNESYGNSPTKEGRGRYEKPMFYSETGPHECWKCDTVGVEIIRSAWKTPFTGAAGALEWIEPSDLSVFEKINTFIQDVDLEGEHYHPGIFKLDNNKLLFKENWMDDCKKEDESADLIYMRSGDRKKAFGVLSNRTYNYYTRGGCNVYADTLPDTPNAGDTTIHKYRPKPPFLQSFGVAGPSSGNNALKLRNMKVANYQINYYSMNDPNLLIGSETQWGPQINLNFPPLNENNWIILFTAHRTNTNFKSASADSTDNDLEKSLQRSEEKSTESFQLYPNPTSDKLYYSIGECKKTNIVIHNMVGQSLFETNNTTCSGQIDVSKLNKGIYTITFETSSKTLKKRFIIN